jgi:ABC-type glycerol-3-phosphate transport system permease component
MVDIGRGGRVARVGGNAWLLLGVFLTVMPFVYMVVASFKPGNDLFSIPFRFWPENLYLGNYDLLLDETNFVRWFGNSIFVSLSRTLIAIALSIMAGYAFAKFEFPPSAPSSSW